MLQISISAALVASGIYSNLLGVARFVASRIALLALVLIGAPGLTYAQQAVERIPSNVRAQLERGDQINVLFRVSDDVALLSEAKRPVLRTKQEVRHAIKAQLLTAVIDRHLEVLRQYDQMPMLALHVRSLEGLERLAGRSEVLEIYEDIRLYPILSQSLPLIGQPLASTAGQQGNGTAIAVLDTGLDYTRSEFGGCTAPGVPSSCRVAYAFDAAVEDFAADALGHGTMVSGIVTASAPAAKLIGIDVFDGTSASSVDVVEGINWAIANRANYNIVAINMSLGGATKYTSPCSAGNPFRTAISAARTAGIISFVASGNDGFVDGLAMPACTPEAVSVGAVYDANVGAVTWSNCSDSTTAANKVACFSNSASMLNLLAPGALITVTGSTGGGTSFAAPHAAGAYAVLRGARSAEWATTSLARLSTYGVAVTDARNGLSTPRIDLAAALQLPVNDALASATVITGSSGAVSGNSELATAESGEQAHADATPIRSVWWKWTAPSGGDATFTTAGSGFDTVLAAYTGNAVGSLSLSAQNNNVSMMQTSSLITFRATAGTTYYIAVAGNAGATGSVTLNWSLVEPLADLAVSLTATPNPVISGSPVTYTAVVTNLGPYLAESVLLNIKVPEDASILSVGESCTAVVGSVACVLGNLVVGGTVTRDVVMLASMSGNLTVSASVDGAWGDAVASNDAADATVVVSPPVASNDSGDAPLPLWAMMVLAAGLLGSVRKRC